MKIVYLARRRADLAHHDVVTHWRDVNIPDVAAELEPDRYTVTFFDERPHTTDHQWDGMAVVWFHDDDRGRSRTAAHVPEAARRNGFADMLEEVVRFEATEHTFVDRGPLPPEVRKLTFLVVPRPAVPHRAVVAHWIDVHGPAVAAAMADIPGALRYVASPAVAPAGGYAGITELFYADRGAAAAHAAALADDGFSALADNRVYFVGHEVVGVAR